MKQTLLALLIWAAACNRQPPPTKDSGGSRPAAEPSQETAALEVYDVSVNTETVRRGQQVSYCFKARNAKTVAGGPGKFFKGGAPDGDCLMHTPARTTTYEITVTGTDGRAETRSVTVNVK